MRTLNEPAAKRIGKLIRMFGSSFENERHVALAKLLTLLDEEHLTLNEIAVVIENANGEIEQLKYSDSDAEVIFAKGVEKGRKENTGPTLSKQFFDADGEPLWVEIAKFCESNPARTSLNPKEQEFVDEMPARLRWRSPSRPQGGFLLSIFWKLGGTFK
jgi:hypothetical protein